MRYLNGGKLGILLPILLYGCGTMTTEKMPDYVFVNLEDPKSPGPLREKIQALTFPLKQEDLSDIQTLEAKFDAEGNCSGLAAPQIGISKKVIVFAAPDNPDLKKFRTDFTQSMEKSIWINPTYQPIGTDMTDDWEACFSVPDIAGLVSRYKKVRYTAYSVEGQPIHGEAEGFLARIIQHETDHINGRLFIDLVQPDKLMRLDDYRKMRADAMAAKEKVTQQN